MSSATDRPQCSVEGCGEPAKSRKASFCLKHYTRMRRHGHTDQLRPWSRAIGDCLVEDCDKPVKSGGGGMCAMHATRVSRHGDPDAFTHQRDRNLPRGPESRRWAGDGVTYAGMHLRVRYQRGKASAHLCAECGKQAAHWSYDHADPAEIKADEGAFSLDTGHYVPRCVPCHKTFDLSLMPPKINPAIDLDEVRRLHGEGVRAAAMAKLFGVGRGSIERVFDLLGLPRFPLGGPRRGVAA